MIIDNDLVIKEIDSMIFRGNVDKTLESTVFRDQMMKEL
jgi:hypothetical protein